MVQIDRWTVYSVSTSTENDFYRGIVINRKVSKTNLWRDSQFDAGVAEIYFFKYRVSLHHLDKLIAGLCCLKYIEIKYV